METLQVSLSARRHDFLLNSNFSELPTTPRRRHMLLSLWLYCWLSTCEASTPLCTITMVILILKRHTRWLHQTTPKMKLQTSGRMLILKQKTKQQLNPIFPPCCTMTQCISASPGQRCVYTMSSSPTGALNETSKHLHMCARMCGPGWLLVYTLLETVMVTDEPIIHTCWG